MQTDNYLKIREFQHKYPWTVLWRSKQHIKIIDKHLNPGEEILYIFGGQKNDRSVDIFNSYVIAFTNKRIMVATKRVLFGYFFKSLTPDMYNDLTVHKGLFWGRVEIDTIKEVITITNLDARALDEIETNITEIMLKLKKELNLENKEKNKKTK